ncbi:MAG TPA: hypothetical protein VFB25_02000 [Gaiellaceae bacterium]|nr:hypothetical protein [Gaiellaceae bacterium]
MSAFNANIEFAVLIAVVVAAFNFGVHRLPPVDPAHATSTRQRRRSGHEDDSRARDDARRTWAWFIGWGGFICAVVSVIGFQSLPSLRVVWTAFVALAIASVPVGAVVALVGTSPRPRRR